jgi:hypothetical protein
MSTPVVIGPLHQNGEMGIQSLGVILDACSQLGCPSLVISDKGKEDPVLDMMRDRNIPDGRIVSVCENKDGSLSLSIKLYKEDGPYSDRLGIIDCILPGNYPVPLVGSFQIYNTSMALLLSLLSIPEAMAYHEVEVGNRDLLKDLINGCSDVFSCKYSDNEIRELLREGLLGTRIRGRFEVISDSNPVLIFDGGHNQEAARSISRSLKQEYGEKEVPILLAMMKDKDPIGYMEQLLDVSGDVVITGMDEERSFIPYELEELIPIKQNQQIFQIPDTKLAIQKWKELAIDRGIGFAGGSFYLYRYLLEHFKMPS